MGERERKRASFRPRSVRAQCLVWSRFYEFVYESVLNDFSGWPFIRVTFYPQNLSALSDSSFYPNSFCPVDLFAILSKTSSTNKFVKFYPTPNYLPGHQSSNFIYHHFIRKLLDNHQSSNFIHESFAGQLTTPEHNNTIMLFNLK